MNSNLAGKTALITGAAVRLGRATALALGEQGVNVVVHYNRSLAEAGSLHDELISSGVKSWLVQADLLVDDDLQGLIPRVQEITGGFDILINNASIFPPDTMSGMTFESVMHNMRVNAWAPYLLGRDFAKYCKTGNIINFLDARLPGYDWQHASYTLSKHTLALLTRMTALEYAPDIRVNAVAPGLILPPPGKDESFLEPLIPLVPLGRHGTAEEIAQAVIYLLQNEFITGETVYIDGGRHLKEPSHGSNTY
ncbi:MAG: SDR family oxidoreductase [bacterium]